MDQCFGMYLKEGALFLDKSSTDSSTSKAILKAFGLEQNHDGAFALGLYGSLWWSNILRAEIHALLVDLTLCWQANFHKIICYSDSLHAVQLMTIGNHIVITMPTCYRLLETGAVL